MDAISAGNTWITQQGLNIAGYSNKLPSPDIGALSLAAAPTLLSLCTPAAQCGSSLALKAR